MSIDAALSTILRLLLPVAAVAVVAFAAFALLDRLALDQQAAERRALAQRNAELTISALASNSALACLDGSAGEAIETACEAAVFASPQSAAAAVAYTAARLTLLADAQAAAPGRDAAFMERFAAVRRAVELDRFGLAAHVLASRDGCTAERCAAFALIGEATALKANLKVRVFEQYVSRYAAAWDAPATQKQTPAVSEAPTAPAAPALAAAVPPGHPVSGKYDFPSAASIPPVSIMNAEPVLPKEAAGAQASQPKEAAAPQAEGTAVPVPPKRPQSQATPPQAR